MFLTVTLSAAQSAPQSSTPSAADTTAAGVVLPLTIPQCWYDHGAGRCGNVVCSACSPGEAPMEAWALAPISALAPITGGGL